MPSDNSVDDLICGVCELRAGAGAVAITEKANENVGPGLQSINRFHVHYAASEEDGHRGEEGVVFIDRSIKALNVDWEALEDTHRT
jgi:hypothetical protein